MLMSVAFTRACADGVRIANGKMHKTTTNPNLKTNLGPSGRVGCWNNLAICAIIPS